ncbi:MAG: hypothetical protein R6W93_12575 [Candidatus Limnocylindrales bacterium]
MARRRHEAESRTSRRSSNGDVRSREETDDLFEDWERYPAAQAEENIEYQKVAWYGAPFGDAGVALLMLAAVVNVLRRVGRAMIGRLAHR